MQINMTVQFYSQNYLLSKGFSFAYHFQGIVSVLTSGSGSSNYLGSRYFKPTLFLFLICLIFSIFGFSVSSNQSSSILISSSLISTSTVSMKLACKEQMGLLRQYFPLSYFDAMSYILTQESKLEDISSSFDMNKSVMVVVLPLNLPIGSQFFLESHWKISPMSFPMKQQFLHQETFILVNLALAVVLRIKSLTGLLFVPLTSYILSLFQAFRIDINLSSRPKAPSISFIGTYKSSQSCFTFLPRHQTMPIARLQIQGRTPLPQKRYFYLFQLEQEPLNL